MENILLIIVAIAGIIITMILKFWEPGNPNNWEPEDDEIILI